MRVLLFLPLALAFACLALLSLLAFLGVMILARTLQVIAARPDPSSDSDLDSRNALLESTCCSPWDSRDPSSELGFGAGPSSAAARPQKPSPSQGDSGPIVAGGATFSHRWCESLSDRSTPTEAPA